MKKRKKISFLNNEKGQATLEAIPLLFIFVIFIGYALGAFGIVHTGILHSIAARTYAFETFRHRANVTWFRSNKDDAHHFDSNFPTDQKFNYRLHSIKHERGNDAGSGYGVATERPMSFGFGSNQEVGRNENTHNNLVMNIQSGQRERRAAVNPVWIRAQYGICINANCGQ